MVVTRLRVRDFRSYAAADVGLGERLTVVHGPNGAGKTNLLEALYFGCTGRSSRTATSASAALRRRRRQCRARRGPWARPRWRARAQRRLPAGEAKRFKVDGAPAEGLLDAPHRPWSASSSPIGSSSSRARPRCAARTSTRSSARCGRAARPRAASTRRRSPSATRCSRACARAARARPSRPGPRARPPRNRVAQRPRRGARAAAPALRRRRGRARSGRRRGVPLSPPHQGRQRRGLAAELAERLDADLERGFTTHGPHRDDVALLRDGRELRAYGSQGEQRMGLLALLLAERAVLEDERGAPPLLLLDDVMSELDFGRRERLVERLRAGQALVTTPTSRTCPAPTRRTSSACASRTASSPRTRYRMRRRASVHLARGRRARRPLAPQTTGRGPARVARGGGRRRRRPGRADRGARRRPDGDVRVVGVGAGARPHGPGAAERINAALGTEAVPGWLLRRTRPRLA